MSTRPFDTVVHRRKRVRFATDSSSSSEPSASSTIHAPSDATAASDYESDSSSTLSESSDEPSSESSSEDEDDEDMELEEHAGRNGITSLRAGQGKKPTMKLDKDELGPDIRDFLKDFLPKLKASNDELEMQRVAGTLKEREIDGCVEVEGEPYIEMDLGLGVLEEKDQHAEESEESESDEDMQDSEKEKDVLAKLMGRETKKDGVVIQEVQDAQAQ